MSNGKFTLDDALRATSAIVGGCGPTARVGLSSVVVSTMTINSAINTGRIDGETAEIAIARSLLTHHTEGYLERRERELSDSEASVERARKELEAARALVASLRAAVEASK